MLPGRARGKGTPAELTAITLATARGEVGAEALSIWLRQRTQRREGF